MGGVSEQLSARARVAVQRLKPETRRSEPLTENPHRDPSRSNAEQLADSRRKSLKQISAHVEARCPCGLYNGPHIPGGAELGGDNMNENSAELYGNILQALLIKR
ncbi:unnamed protein product [Gadus morhua 'NCC']